MSRSYKKTPHWKAGNSSRVGKKLANSKVRALKRNGKLDDVADGGAYKKLYNSYNVCDAYGLVEKWLYYQQNIIERHERWVNRGYAEPDIDWKEEYRIYRRFYVNK